jgi:Flp pilus assembly protein TadG
LTWSNFIGSARFREDVVVLGRALRTLWPDQQGSALLEGAVVLPLLFVVMFGVYDFSWYFYQQHLITTGVRDAARYLARSSSPCDATSPVWAIEATNAGNLATTAAVTGGGARVKGWLAGMVTIDCTPVDNRAGVDGLRVYRGNAVIYVVTVSTRFSDPSFGFFRMLGLPSPIISVSHSQRVIGPG